MSPPPATAAATGRRHGTRRGPAPRVPRRVSGPARPRVVATGGAVALPRPGAGGLPLGRRLLRSLAALPDHPLLVRLLTGRAWLGVLAFALIGIVFMQVSLLKLNAGIGRAVERAALLDRENADLRDVVSRLGSDERLQAEAEKMGLVLPPAGSVVFLGRNGQRVGGDGPVALATGTATGPQPAGVGAGALVPTNTAPEPNAVAASAAATTTASPTTSTSTASTGATTTSATPSTTSSATATSATPATTTTGAGQSQTTTTSTTPTSPAGGASAP